MTNTIDTSVKTKIIKESGDAKKAKELMHKINAINQQVMTVLFLLDPQNDKVIKTLPDFACIEIALRILDIRKWQKAIVKLLKKYKLNEQPTIEEIHQIQKEFPEAFK